MTLIIQFKKGVNSVCCTINKTTEANWSNKVQQNDSHSEKKGNSKIKLKKTFKRFRRNHCQGLKQNTVYVSILFIHCTHLTQSPLVSILIRIFLKILFTLLTSSDNAFFDISDLTGPGQMIWTPILYSDNSRRAVSK